MGLKELKQAVDDCIINFDRKVLVTDLLQDYQMAYDEVDKFLADYITEEEKKGTKFEKRFLISGEDKDTENEIYTVVNSETKVKEWLRKLKNAESALYSVEVAGGAKPAADVFKPMKWCANRLENVKTREPLKWVATANGSGDISIKTETKAESKKPKGFDFTAKKPTSTESNNKTQNIVEKETKKTPTSDKSKTSPKEKQTTPEEQKPAAVAKSTSKKGIAGFFGPAKTEDKTKKATGVVKPPTPKKMQDFFKKTDKLAPISKSVKEDKTANISMQLFADEEDENNTDDDDVEMKTSSATAIDVESSDDEAQLEAIRRQCSEKDETETSTSSAANKRRRRIIDSDDDDEQGAPLAKQEKKDETEQKETSEEHADNNETGQSETFLDEDGFVITIKAKKPAVSKKPVKAVTPKKSPPKPEASKKTPKVTSKPAAKTKQGNIMNFFNKK